MSRREREDKDSQSKRHHSRFDREPSPKKSRREGQQVTGRTHSRSHLLDIQTHNDRDRGHRRRLQDALPPELPPSIETKKQAETVKVGSEKKVDVHTEIPKSRSSFQHDERRSAGHGGQSFTSKSSDQGRWNNRNQPPSHRLQEKVDEKKAWMHDEYFELENAAPSARKKRAFREKKIEALPETAELTKLIPEKREERGHYSRENKLNRAIPIDDDRNIKRGSYQSRDRFGGAGPRGRDRFDGGFGNRRSMNHNSGGGFQIEKWKHDLFDEANKSPTLKNEEEEIAKVEALLAL